MRWSTLAVLATLAVGCASPDTEGRHLGRLAGSPDAATGARTDAAPPATSVADAEGPSVPDRTSPPLAIQDTCFPPCLWDLFVRCRVPGVAGPDASAGNCAVRDDGSVYDPITGFGATTLGFGNDPAVAVTLNGATCYEVAYGGSSFGGFASNEATFRDGEGNVVAIHRIGNDVVYCGASLANGVPYAVDRSGACDGAQQAVLIHPYYTTTGCTRAVDLPDGGRDGAPTPPADSPAGTVTSCSATGQDAPCLAPGALCWNEPGLLLPCSEVFDPVCTCMTGSCECWGHFGMDGPPNPGSPATECTSTADTASCTATDASCWSVNTDVVDACANYASPGCDCDDAPCRCWAPARSRFE